jgi:hypothetical protein
MLVKFDNTPNHKKKYKIFLEKLYRKNISEEETYFKNPFEYYKFESGAVVQLWLLIVDNEVTGSVITKTQKYHIKGKKIDVHFLKYPVTLSSVDKNYVYSAAYLASEIKKNFKNSFLLGMGGSKSNVAKFFSSARFINIDIPFFLKPVTLIGLVKYNPFISKYKIFSKKFPKNFKEKIIKKDFEIKLVENIKSLDFWKKTSFSLIRCTKIINAQTPSKKFPFKKFEIRYKGNIVSNIIILESATKNHKYFGDLNIWTILEFEIFCCENLIKKINSMLISYAKKTEIDAIIINTNSKTIKNFCKKNFWINLPTNFCVSFSPNLANSINKFDDIHITRLDGDGPINLGVNLS